MQMLMACRDYHYQQFWRLHPGESVECYFFEEDIVTNVTHDMIKKRTSKDSVLSKVLQVLC